MTRRLSRAAEAKGRATPTILSGIVHVAMRGTVGGARLAGIAVRRSHLGLGPARCTDLSVLLLITVAVASSLRTARITELCTGHGELPKASSLLVEGAQEASQ